MKVQGKMRKKQKNEKNKIKFLLFFLSIYIYIDIHMYIFIHTFDVWGLCSGVIQYSRQFSIVSIITAASDSACTDSGTPNFRNKVSTYVHNKDPLQPSCLGNIYIYMNIIDITMYTNNNNIYIYITPEHRPQTTCIYIV